jgi:hypothetical protein
VKTILLFAIILSTLSLLVSCSTTSSISRETVRPRPNETNEKAKPPSSATLEAKNSPADLRGIYVWTLLTVKIGSEEERKAVSTLSLPGIDGMLLRDGWASLEPSKGRYDWSDLDRWMEKAISLHKNVLLAISAGNNTPDWVFQTAPGGAGATPLNFTISPHEGKRDQCIPETIAAPWDSAFINSWDSFLSALSSHLKSTREYDAITLLRFTGINRTSDELRLPAETPESTDLPCVTDAIKIWKEAGYRPSLLLRGWDAVVSSFQKNFPDKSFSVAIVPNPPQIPFPTIAENGSTITGDIPDQYQPLLALASRKLSGRLVVQNNFLMPDIPVNPAVIDAHRTFGTMVAFQTNNLFALTNQGSACGGTVAKPTPCTASSYMQLLETGIYPLGKNNPLRAQYIEVFAENANDFPEDILRAHRELFTSP